VGIPGVKGGTFGPDCCGGRFLDDTLSSLYFVQSPTSTLFPFLPRNTKVFDDSVIDLLAFQSRLPSTSSHIRTRHHGVHEE
jgi:hypothetical protein